MEAMQVARITLITALAVAKALKDIHVDKVSIKWPNDVLVHGKKISGVLTEISLQGEKLSYSVTGVGVNVNNKADELPQRAISVREALKREFDIADLAHIIIKYLDGFYGQLSTSGFKELLSEIKDFSGLILGERVRVTSESSVAEGYAIDFDENGGLVLRLDNGFLKTVHTGHLTKAEM